MLAHPLPKRDVMYQALVQKDSQFEGIFFAAIKTTGIFCRLPDHRVRKPPILERQGDPRCATNVKTGA